MGKVTIFEMSGSAMESAVARQTGTLEVMAAPRGMRFKVEIEYDSKIEKEAAEDPLLDQEMRDAVRVVYSDLIERVTSGPLAVMPSIKECVGDMATVKSKYGGIVAKAHEAAKSLNQVLVKLEAARKDFLADVQEKLDKHPSPLAKSQPKKIAEQLDEALAPFVGKVQDALASVIAAQTRLKTAEPKMKVADFRVRKLEAMKGLGRKVFDNALILTDVVLSFVDPGSYEKTAELLAGVGQAAGSLIVERISKKALEGSFLE
ncbi:MAG: hypothetical protein H7238_06605 [Polaromonas sp.]|nr:hypothetical protein [Polaromonas sp.]